ncbi:MAG: DUF998 domain-containing protein [Cyclobacteriaceae bacterium]|nr:DUF998 domain-containing protein [Cyclobacteriaceae bacterium]
MSDPIPVPVQLRRRLWLGVIGSCLFIFVASVESIQRPVYDPWQQSISALSLGSRGWIQILNFFAFGTIILSTVPAWHKILKGRKGNFGFSNPYHINWHKSYFLWHLSARPCSRL